MADTFQKALKDEEYIKPEKNTPHKVGNNPDKKEYRKEKAEGNKTAHQKKKMAGKMDKYGVNMCKVCGSEKHSTKGHY